MSNKEKLESYSSIVSGSSLSPTCSPAKKELSLQLLKKTPSASPESQGTAVYVTKKIILKSSSRDTLVDTAISSTLAIPSTLKDITILSMYLIDSPISNHLVDPQISNEPKSQAQSFDMISDEPQEKFIQMTPGSMPSKEIPSNNGILPPQKVHQEIKKLKQKRSRPRRVRTNAFTERSFMESISVCESTFGWDERDINSSRRSSL